MPLTYREGEARGYTHGHSLKEGYHESWYVGFYAEHGRAVV